jgi:hypothetical protein
VRAATYHNEDLILGQINFTFGLSMVGKELELVGVMNALVAKSDRAVEKER